jgi:hypothetical protein
MDGVPALHEIFLEPSLDAVDMQTRTMLRYVVQRSSARGTPVAT